MAQNTSSLLINVNDLLSLQGVETQRVEFKAAWNAEKTHNRGTYWQVVHSICAFANDFYNDNGGYIIIGVEEKEDWENSDDRQITLPPRGVPAKDLDRIQKEIMGACRANIKPDFFPILSPELVQGKHVLVVWATASDNSPHQCREHNKGENHYYIRKASETKKASPEEIKHLIEQHSKIPFDDRKASCDVTGRQLSEDDIDINLVKKFLKDVGSNHKDLCHENLNLLYQNLKLVRRIGEKKVEEILIPIFVPLNVALLFFSPEPQKYLRGAQSEIATYNHDNDPVDDKPLTGPIDQQIEAILSYILDEKKEEVPYTFVPYPMRALREAVVNAFYHRGYEPEHCEPVKVHIYPNYIDIISYPGPDPSLKMEHFVEGQEIPPVKARNRRIGELLKDRKLAEARGSGVRTIFRTMKQNKSPIPSFWFDPTFFRVRLPGHPKHTAHALYNKVDNLCAKGEKQSAVELLTTSLKENPNMNSDILLGKLLELHDNNKSHPNVQPYQQFISERLERRCPLITELCKWSVSDSTVDITVGVNIVEKLVEEGATSNDLQSAIKKAVEFLNERGDDGKRALEQVQNAHKLFKAMGEVTQSDPYVAYQFGCCKFKLYKLNTKGKDIRKKRDLAPLLKDAEDFIQKALQLTSKEHKNHLATQHCQLGYIYFQLLFVKKSTVKDVMDCYNKAKQYNPRIKINQFYIPSDYRSQFMESA